MVHCSDVGNRLSEFCSTKVHRKAETDKKFARKSGALDNVRESFKRSRVITDSIEEVAVGFGQSSFFKSSISGRASRSSLGSSLEVR